MSALTVLHLAPHPDDEVIGAGATLIGLREAGHQVVNLACSLGREEDHDRRLAEVRDANDRADFELQVHDPPLDISEGDDLELAQRLLAQSLVDLIPKRGVAIVVSPSPHDGHHGHEVVGRAARDALRRVQDAPRWWMWGLWADLPFPTLVFPFEDDRLARVRDVLSAHTGELARNDYDALIPARATVNRVLGAETAFGYGHEGLDASYVDLLTEAVQADGGWHAAAPRILDSTDPLGEATARQPLDWWLDAPSAGRRMAEESARS